MRLVTDICRQTIRSSTNRRLSEKRTKFWILIKHLTREQKKTNHQNDQY
jgi:hypothetical protein